MNILEQIIANKAKEIQLRKQLFSVSDLERRPIFSMPCYSLTDMLNQPHASGLIAEIKRKSPSQGTIHSNVSVGKISTGYEKAGASGLSILTDQEFFGGSDDDLILARSLTTIPLLRKDFIIDEYQLIEAKSLGADVVLLIAACLSPVKVKQFITKTHEIGMEVLIEVHNEFELKGISEANADLIGVNNRNLKTFEVSVDTSRRLANLIPDHILKISESGIDSVETIMELKSLGYKGFLMGQNFMKHEHPELACQEFIRALRTKLMVS